MVRELAARARLGPVVIDQDLAQRFDDEGCRGLRP
jgi:hypothetical protein